MSCLVPLGGHTKMDTILTYWQQLTFQIRWEELLWRSHLSRWKWIWIQAITRNSSLCDYAIREVPAQSKPVWMYQWCPTWMNQPFGMNSCTNRMSLTLQSGCINNAPALYEPHKGKTGYARTLKSNTGYYKHRLVCKDETRMKRDCKAGMLQQPTLNYVTV